MLRDKSLIPLSRQHQHALALCVRIERASPVGKDGLIAWQKEITEHFRSEIGQHFIAEEQVVFPVARGLNALVPLVEDLRSDHTWLRESFARAEAGSISARDLSEFTQRLSAHIRKEERELFERLQELMGPEELDDLGRRLADALGEPAQTCILPNEETKLRAKK